MAALFVAGMGIGGWLMYEAWKGQDIASLKTKVKNLLANGANNKGASTQSDVNALDTGSQLA